MPKDILPDPSGGPRPVDAGSSLVDFMATLFAAGLVLFIGAALLTPTMGATRSTRLKWEERKRQMQEAADRAAKPESATERKRQTQEAAAKAAKAKVPPETRHD